MHSDKYIEHNKINTIVFSIQLDLDVFVWVIMGNDIII